ncbi:MAG: autotransporter outer membrane beta-barrel domain-containing protein [Blastochloris sp.]|nr:autotransporter outer membrane beta-barrel domain-containing protein [Blastochloris sp.]
MNTLYRFLALTLLTLTLASSALASSSSDAGQEISSFNPNFVPTDIAVRGTENGVSRSSSATSLGTDMSKELEPASEKLKDNSWFSSPAVYAETYWTGSNDNRVGGIENDRFGFLVGFDFITKKDFVVGLMYNYSHDWGSIREPGADVDLDTHNHSFTLYTGKNFWNWLNVGATLSGGVLDNDAEPLAAPGTNFGQETTFYTPSVYAGLAHTWDALSFASTVSYIYTDESCGFQCPWSPQPRPKLGHSGLAQQTFLQCE